MQAPVPVDIAHLGDQFRWQALAAEARGGLAHGAGDRLHDPPGQPRLLTGEDRLPRGEVELVEEHPVGRKYLPRDRDELPGRQRAALALVDLRRPGKRERLAVGELGPVHPEGQ